MIYALSRAAQELFDDIQRYNIKVIPSQNMIAMEVDGTMKCTKLRDYTPKTICKREIRKYIKWAKKLEADKQLEKQSTLFGEVS